MPEPSEYLVVKALQTALLGISVAAGYYSNMAAGAVKLDPNHNVKGLVAPDGPRPFAIIEVAVDADQYAPAMVTSFDLPVTVHWVNTSDRTDDDDRLKTFFRGCADVELAIARAFIAGSIPKTSIKKRSMSYAVDGSLIWAEIEMTMLIHRRFGQPS